MKVSFATLLAMVLIVSQAQAMTIDRTNPAWIWFESYLTGMDLLLMLVWKQIYYYTWLILAQWIMCTWFSDLGSMFVPGSESGTVTKEEMSVYCNAGVENYFDATMYGGDTDNLPYAYFRSLKKN